MVALFGRHGGNSGEDMGAVRTRPLDAVLADDVESLRLGGVIHYSTPWMSISLGLYAVISVLGLFIYAPLLKKQQSLAETKGADDAEYQHVARNGIILGTIIVLLTIVITFFMATKPVLWG